jgi:hypothetical protein
MTATTIAAPAPEPVPNRAVALHPVPEQSVVVKEQIESVSIAIRKEQIAFLVTLAVVVLRGGHSHTPGNEGIEYGPAATIPMTLVALLIPFGVWRSSDRERRAYDWAMPVAQSTHTIVRMLAGWLWLMLGVAIYLAVIVLFQVVMVGILGGSMRVDVPAWQWLAPFTSVSIAYLLTSIAMIGSEHPWRWIGGIIIGYLIAMLVLETLRMPDVRYVLQQIVSGTYGLGAAIFGDVRDHTAFGPAPADPTRWLGATAIWGVLSIAGVWLAARRHSTS